MTRRKKSPFGKFVLMALLMVLLTGASVQDASAATINDTDAIVLFREQENSSGLCLGNFYYSWDVDKTTLLGSEFFVFMQGYNGSNLAPRESTGADGYFFADWNGDGIDEMGARYGPNMYCVGRSYLPGKYKNGDISAISFFGRATDDFLVGDWDGDGGDELCVRRGNVYYFTDSFSGSGSAQYTATFGRASDQVVVGDWDGDGTDTLAVIRNNTTVYFQQGSVTSDKSVSWKFASSANSGLGLFNTVLAGDWNGDGTDTICLRVGNRFYYARETTSGYVFLNGGTAGRSTDKVFAVRY